MAGSILKPVSGQAELSTTEHPSNGVLRHEMTDLRVGDVVRSKEKYWLKTGQHFSGAIVRFEKVPKSQSEAVGSDFWAYLNTGEGPISLDLLEQAPTMHSQLESLNAALGNFQPKVQPDESINESHQAFTNSVPLRK